MSGYRSEHDSMGTVRVPEDKLWGAQTERSRNNFAIGTEKMPQEIIRAIALIKKAASLANGKLVPRKMTEEKRGAICAAADEILAGELWDHFPLAVWQTGSGTQTNMNVNEVIANRGNSLAGTLLLHPNDDVNLSQSSNDVFPAAMRVAAILSLEDRLLPAVGGLIETFRKLEAENTDAVKIGRTHLQDAVPILFSQEISGWRASLEQDRRILLSALQPLMELPLGGTAVGTGLNAPAGFGALAVSIVSDLTGKPFVTPENRFHALTSLDEMVFAHGAMKALAGDLMKIANDVRLLSSGPRCGLGEIAIPANEPGSSIMPGKVNPTQCEQVTMVAVQVMANDVAVGLASSQGQLQLNTYLPVCAAAFLQSARLLADSIASFDRNCVRGIRPVRERMKDNLDRSLMTVTALTPYIGYENAARVAQLAHGEGVTLREACEKLRYLSPERFDELFHPEEMAKGSKERE